MASRKNINTKRAVRHGQKNAARRNKTTPRRAGVPRHHVSAPADVHEGEPHEGFTCAVCGVQSRPDDDEWSAFAIPNYTSDVRFVCPSHSEAATAESVFIDLFPQGLPVAKCERCGRTRQPGDTDWSVQLDAGGRVLSNLCPLDQSSEERAEMSANTSAYEQLLAESVTTGGRESELHLLGRADFACRSVFEEHIRPFLDENVPSTQRLVTRKDVVDWAAEAVDRLSPPEDLRADFLVAFVGQYAMWLEIGLEATDGPEV